MKTVDRDARCPAPVDKFLFCVTLLGKSKCMRNSIPLVIPANQKRNQGGLRMKSFRMSLYGKALVSCLALIGLCAVLQAQEVYKAYGIKSAVIEYKHSGSRTGTTTMYFDNYGAKSATQQNLTTRNKLEKGWILSLDDTIYMFDPATKKGVKMGNPMAASLKKEKDYDKAAKAIYAKMGYTEAAPEQWLGRECKVYSGKMGKVLTWNGLLMYMETKVGTTVSKQEATKVDINVPVKASVFELPKDIEFSDMPSFGF